MGKRIAVLATFMFIKNNQFKDTLKISEILLKDKHDLIHKAVDWALREVWKERYQIRRRVPKEALHRYTQDYVKIRD